MSRIKVLDLSEVEEFADRGWGQPVELRGSAIPASFGNRSECQFVGWIASGSRSNSVEYESKWIPDCRRIGGIFAYRLDESDAPDRINRDDYMIVESRNSGRVFLEGPFKNRKDHHSTEIPERYKGLERLGIEEES